VELPQIVKYNEELKEFVLERMNEDNTIHIIKNDYCQTNLLYIRKRTYLENLIEENEAKSLVSLKDLFSR
jgi:hypothetical protein